MWEEVLYMPIVHQYEMIIDVYDEDMIGSDDLIGRAVREWKRVEEREEEGRGRKRKKEEERKRERRKKEKEKKLGCSHHLLPPPLCSSLFLLLPLLPLLHLLHLLFLLPPPGGVVVASV